MTRRDRSLEETATLGYDVETEEEWLDEGEELPHRRRRKLFAPVPVALMGAVLLAGGFLAGVEVEKGQSKSSSAGGGFAGLAALRGGGSRTGSGGGRGSGASFPGAGGGFPGGSGFAGGLTRGEVSYVSGSTLYVTSGEGNTVKVSARAGTRVSKTVSTSLHSIHPGDAVTVTGSQGKNGSVTASSISVSSSGSSAGSSSSSGSGGAGAGLQLFGSG
ncbi:MAG TPA: hypothetical protein VNZ05_09425 [Solirubrobacteraceae bacterium]|jgi:hypothetical protein|nr:hypothetical protein [Solirubrobacteraceae bacterium]